VLSYRASMDAGEEVLGRIRVWRDSGRPVTLVRVVGLRGISGQQGTMLAALTPDEPMAGTVLSGVADEVLAPVERGRLMSLHIGDEQAGRVGLSCGGVAQVLLQPLDEIPAQAWQLLADREPVCLVTELDGDAAGLTEVHAEATITAADRAHPGVARLFGKGTSEGAVVDEGRAAVTALWPRPELVVVGSGAIANALAATAGLLEWTSTIVNSPGEAATAAEHLAGCDGIVVLSHDRDVDGPALTAALAGHAGYIGALGSRHTQQARREWLAEHGVTDLSRVHGPAGLDVNARTPAEIAISVLAEMLAERSGRAPVSLRDRSGPLHA
jgi:xanthine dehydrogenase accessory factor